jgi:hypothetical protein
VFYEFEEILRRENHVAVDPHNEVVVQFAVKWLLVYTSLNRCTKTLSSHMVDVAHIVLRKSVRNFVFGEFCEEISPTLQKPAGVRCTWQAKYNFHNEYLLK